MSTVTYGCNGCNRPHFFQVVGDILCMENSAYPTIVPIHSTYKIAMEWEQKPHLGTHSV